MRRFLWLPLIVAACAGDTPPPRERVLLVTTTTVEGSGLLDELVEAYEASQARFQVSATALGSGAALELGRRGDADLLLTHDPVGEAAFMEEGHGAEQGPVMENEFVLAGPPADPAEIRGMTDLSAALLRIARSDATFVSRADQSGTHSQEIALWRQAGRSAPETSGEGYVEAGSGMDETLRIASQRGAYTLTDIGTFLHLRDGLDLALLARGDPPVVNRYSYTLPTDPRNPDGARDFLAWLRGTGQDVIGHYGVARFGRPLFRPTGQPDAARAPSDSVAPDTSGAVPSDTSDAAPPALPPAAAPPPASTPADSPAPVTAAPATTPIGPAGG